MAEIEEICKFETGVDQVKFSTRTNGDALHVKGFHLTPEAAAALTYLINLDNDVVLKWRVKIKES